MKIDKEVSAVEQAIKKEIDKDCNVANGGPDIPWSSMQIRTMIQQAVEAVIKRRIKEEIHSGRFFP